MSLTPVQHRQIELILAQLDSDEHAPTTIKDRERALRTHIADSLVALELPAMRSPRTLADLGSGAGFPGVVLAVAMPEAQVSLVESQRRKCEFLERMCAAAGLSNAEVVCARVEEWSDGVVRNDVIVARALGPQPVVLEYAAPLLRIGGALVDWRGRRDAADELAADKAAVELGLRRVEVRSVTPFAGARDRHLHVFEKVAETPPRFPRRAGIARKRPLGSGGESSRLDRR